MRELGKATLAVAVMVVLASCASAPKGPTDEELVAQVVATWQQAIIDKDIEAAMAIHSENFSNAEAANKEMWKSYLEWVDASGYLDGATIDASGSETVIEEETATVGPIVLSTMAGVFRMQLKLAKEEAGWMVVSSEAR
jgi:hypothetical protein